MSREDMRRVLLVGGMVLAWLGADAPDRARPPHAQGRPDRTRAVGIVGRIQRADYEGNREALRRFSAELAAIEPAGLDDAPLMLYWQGFARWRSAINGFNDGETRQAIEDDLLAAARTFEAARKADPESVDAAAGQISALGYQMYLHRADADRMRELALQVRPLIADASSRDPDHPRLIWVLGPSRWNASPGNAGDAAARQAGVIASYERALDTLRQRPRPEDPLRPAWGEPELLVNLAWSHLNKTTPDPRAAERYATEALTLVPDWHYARDILMPQIRAALPEG